MRFFQRFKDDPGARFRAIEPTQEKLLQEEDRHLTLEHIKKKNEGEIKILQEGLSDLNLQMEMA